MSKRLARKPSTPQDLPTGFALRHTLRGHSDEVTCISFSRDGKLLASGSYDRTARLWDLQTGKELGRLAGPASAVFSVSFSPDGRLLATGAYDGAVRLWDVETGRQLRRLTGHDGEVWTVCFSPDGKTLASACWDRTVMLWDVDTGRQLRRLVGHEGVVNSASFSPDSKLLASGSADHTVRVWDVQTGRQLRRLVGHTAGVFKVSFSLDGKQLASDSYDHSERRWDVGTGTELSRVEGPSQILWSSTFDAGGVLRTFGLASHLLPSSPTATRDPLTLPKEVALDRVPRCLTFHFSPPRLAAVGEDSAAIRVWDLDLAVLLGARPLLPSVSYRNAKVVLVGDSGVGKTGLGLVLTGQPFAATESTHGRNVWTLDTGDVELREGWTETRETLLWDLAGQPGYRLIHQLHLDEVAAALIVFDARSETDPLAGVHHWDRALRQAQRLRGDSVLPMRKLLVSARADRGGVAVSQERIRSLVRDLGFDAYFETSAREGWGIADLGTALRQCIPWESLPQVSSTRLFQTIKQFLLHEREAGRLLSTADDLYRAFLQSEAAPGEVGDLREQFDTCIRLVGVHRLIGRLSFGNLVLLQPELLDSYASAMVNAARDEPQGMGCLAEEVALQCRFRMSQDERIEDPEQEKLLLLATVEDLLRHEIALREQGNDGPILVFPSQFIRDYPEYPEPEGKAIVFGFEGPVLNVYTTLCVRLTHSGIYQKKDMWRNAAVYGARVGGECGLYLRHFDDGRGELILFSDGHASEETCFQFEEYVHTHLLRRALPDTITRRRIFTCEGCRTPILDRVAQWLRERGQTSVNCQVCERPVSLLDREERLLAARASAVAAMDRAADSARDQAAAVSVIEGKLKTGDYDVFLCHNSDDRQAVKEIAERLKEQGILPWLDEWDLRPGLPWQRALEERIESIKSAAVFIGESGIGPWEDQELQAFIRQFVRRQCPVIPVLLPNAPKEPRLPVFLEGMTWVDFRKSDADPLRRLIWGITGERPLR